MEVYKQQASSALAIRAERDLYISCGTYPRIACQKTPLGHDQLCEKRIPNCQSNYFTPPKHQTRQCAANSTTIQGKTHQKMRAFLVRRVLAEPVFIFWKISLILS